MPTFKLHLCDRSRITKDWKCPRARYFNYEYQGRGLVKGTSSLPLFLGTSVHDGLAVIAKLYQQGEPVDIDVIADTVAIQVRQQLLDDTEGEVGATDFAYEQGALTEGLVRGYYAHIWPKLIAQYPKVIAVEEEMKFTLDSDIEFMSKPDLILEDPEGEWHYIEYKTTSSKKDDWIRSWDTAVQLHSTIKSVEQTLGRAPVDVTIIGLYKGYASYGKQNSPMCYAYKRNGNPPFTQDDTVYEYRAGYKRYPTWELPGGVKSWVAGMPEQTLAEQFPQTPPIFISNDLVDAFFAQTRIREHEIQRAMALLEEGNGGEIDDQLLNACFPQQFDACSPAWGFACEYQRLCFSRTVDPLSEGFQFRESHHQQEVDQQNQEDQDG